MPTARTVRLAPDVLALKVATREAVRAAGGQEFVGSEVGRSQSQMSDYCSPNVSAFMPIDIVAKVEALGAGSPGHPHITRALARHQGDLVLDCGDDCERFPLTQLLAEVAGESSDVIRVLAESAGVEGAAVRTIEAMLPAQKAELAREMDGLLKVLTSINQQLRGA